MRGCNHGFVTTSDGVVMIDTPHKPSDALRWKGQFIQSAPDPSVPQGNDRNYWCVHTQTCIGPDGRLAEPGACSAGSGSGQSS